MRETLLTTRLFTVEHREYARPGHETVGRDVVVHPGAVVILPILEDNRIVMIRNYRYTVEQQLWELPAGTIENGEQPRATARRELAEETGYRAATVEPIMTFYTSPGICTELMHAFVASDLTMVGQDLENSEQIIVEPLEVSDIRRRLLAGEFRDGKTIAVLAQHLLGLS